MKATGPARKRFDEQRRRQGCPWCMACVLGLGTLAVAGFVVVFSWMGWL